jgi:hypothetical protein
MVDQSVPTAAISAIEERRLECVTGLHHRLLAMANSRGLLLWCREHNRSHLVTWEDLEGIRQGFQPIPCIPLVPDVYSS